MSEMKPEEYVTHRTIAEAERIGKVKGLKIALEYSRMRGFMTGERFGSDFVEEQILDDLAALRRERAKGKRG